MAAFDIDEAVIRSAPPVSPPQRICRSVPGSRHRSAQRHRLWDRSRILNRAPDGDRRFAAPAGPSRIGPGKPAGMRELQTDEQIVCRTNSEPFPMHSFERGQQFTQTRFVLLPGNTTGLDWPDRRARRRRLRRPRSVCSRTRQNAASDKSNVLARTAVFGAVPAFPWGGRTSDCRR